MIGNSVSPKAAKDSWESQTSNTDLPVLVVNADAFTFSQGGPALQPLSTGG